MKKIFKWLKVLFWLAFGILALMVISFILLNTSYVQNRLLGYATKALSEKLHTNVTIDSVSVKFLSHDVGLHGLCIDDQEGRKMLQVEELQADVSMWHLLYHEVNVSNANITGVKALLYKGHKDKESNYQFLIDELKKDEKNDTSATKLKLDIKELTVNRVSAKYNSQPISLEKLKCHFHEGKLPTMQAEKLKAAWNHPDYKGRPVSYKVGLHKLDIAEHEGNTRVKLEKFHFLNDNHRPRKNTNNPHRGFYDPGHLDITADLTMDITHLDKNKKTMHAVVKHCKLDDAKTGIHVGELTCKLVADLHTVKVSDLALRQESTHVHVPHAVITVPDAAHGKELSFKTSTVTVESVPKDVSRAFVPDMKNFSIPLHITANVDGDLKRINIHNAVVTNADKSLVVKTTGSVTNFYHDDKHQLHAHFDVNHLTADGNVLEEIMKQFPIKRFMMKQLHALGKLNYVGSLDVYWQTRDFRGDISTEVGNFNLDFNIDKQSKYITGKASAESLQLGKVLDMPDIGEAALSTDFKFDFSQERTAEMRRNKGGKLPIGSLTAHVDEASYKFVKVKNIDVSIDSDGAVAEGVLDSPHKFLDLGCSFSFTDTDDLKKLKIKPKLKIHK